MHNKNASVVICFVFICYIYYLFLSKFFGFSVPSSPVESLNNGSLEEQLRSLKIDVFNYPMSSSRVGDSGYMSFQDLPQTGLVTPVNTLEQTSQMGETDLNDHISVEKSKLQNYSENKSMTDNLNLRLKTTALPSIIDESVMSTCSSVWGEDRELFSPTTENWEVPSTQILEHLSNMDNKGSHRSEVQLR